MRYAYYERLSAAGKAVYRRSDEVGSVVLPAPAMLHGFVQELREGLAADSRVAVQSAASRLARGLTSQLELPPLVVSVLAIRPSSGWGELHGLYTRQPRRIAHVQLWMRTARHARVVAFRTFLRTLLHEVGHHVDYELLGLGESFHTEGFFKRESSLFRQLVPDASGGAPRRRPATDHDSPSPRPGRK